MTKGYYRNKEYDHTPEAEKQLFKDALTDLGDSLYGIEIGVLYGETSRFLLKLPCVNYLVGIDPIVPDSMDKRMVGSIDLIEKNTIGMPFDFIQDYSYNVHNDLGGDGSYDFIFIDGDHNYQPVKQDYELYKRLITDCGLIFFHDSRMNRGGAPFHEGSSRFVDELIASNELELIGEAFSLTCFKKCKEWG